MKFVYLFFKKNVFFFVICENCTEFSERTKHPIPMKLGSVVLPCILCDLNETDFFKKNNFLIFGPSRKLGYCSIFRILNFEGFLWLYVCGMEKSVSFRSHFIYPLTQQKKSHQIISFQ